MIIRQCTMADYDDISKIYANARRFMKENGNPNQWGDTRPLPDSIKRDIEENHSWVGEEDGRVIGVFTFFVGHDETYDVIREGNWLNDKPYGVIHKVASAEGVRGFVSAAVEFAFGYCDNLKIDTHEDNKVMQHVLEKNGFTYCGLINTDDGTERLAYQRVR